MVYHGDFNGIEVCFEMGNIFYQQKRLIVKGARNCSEESDKQIPAKIPFEEINMAVKDREEIKARFVAKNKKKQKAKARRKKLAEII